MDKKIVVFLEDRTTVEEKPQTFVAGQVYELPVPSCERWIKRNAARYATADDIAAAKRATEKESKKAAAAAEKAAAEKAAAAGSQTSAQT